MKKSEVLLHLKEILVKKRSLLCDRFRIEKPERMMVHRMNLWKKSG